MSYSQLQLFNLAVDAVGGTGTIATIEEVSREAELCSRWFGPVRDKVLRAAHWHSAKKFARLSEIAERDVETWAPGHPTPGYLYGFAVPADMAHPRFFTTYERFDFSVFDANNHMISTDTPSPVLCYTSRIPVQLMDDGLANALVLALAAHICEPLTGATNKARMRLEEANMAIMSAREQNAEMSHQPAAHIPDFIAARGYGTPAFGQNYIYPYGPLFMAGDIGG
ncbi:MAG TPA: hypothetical protein VIM69_10650 [Opitutaceae bacterium]